jgi:hypothetical protein
MPKPSAEKQLSRFADQLREHVGSTKPFETVISHDLAIAMADAIALVLAGKVSTLDKALGLRRGRGKPKQGRRTKFFDLAVQIHELRARIYPLRDSKPPMTFDKIADRADIAKLAKKLGHKGTIEARWLRKIYEQNSSEVVEYYAECLVNKLNSKPHNSRALRVSTAA